MPEPTQPSPAQLSFFVLITRTRYGKNVVVWGEDGLRSPSPYFPSRNIPYYYKESDCSINDSNLKVD
jgi:hypothetical protein